MKKIFACGAVLSLMLWACGDDTSSAAGDDVLSSSTEQENLSSGLSQGDTPDDGSVSSSVEEPESSADAGPGSSAKATGSSADGTIESSTDGTSSESGTFVVSNSKFERGKCMNNSLAKAAAPAGGSESEKLPEAYLGYAGGEPFIEIHDVSDYCDLVAKISQKVKGDTLFVAYYDITMASKCICPFDSHKFFIDRENAGLPLFSFNDVVYKVVDLLID